MTCAYLWREEEEAGQGGGGGKEEEEEEEKRKSLLSSQSSHGIFGSVMARVVEIDSKFKNSFIYLNRLFSYNPTKASSSSLVSAV